MGILRMCVEADSQLAETISDFMVGVLGMGVEYRADEKGESTLLHGFLDLEDDSVAESDAIKTRMALFAEEMAGLFQVTLPRISIETVPDQDWSHNWKEHFKPFEIDFYNSQAGTIDCDAVADPGLIQRVIRINGQALSLSVRAYPAKGAQTFNNPCKHIFVRCPLIVVRRTEEQPTPI